MPIVNLDSVLAINQDFLKMKNKRKNMRNTECSDLVSNGVDLNRNYPYKWEESKNDPETLQKCSEVYRGNNAMSEPETRAVKTMLDNYRGEVVSAMNFHCWGNLWIHPFNFLGRSGEKNPMESMPNIKALYQRFEEEAPVPKGGEFGRAITTVGYPAPGEASDWMLAYYKIFAWSPELGNRDRISMNFYVSPEEQRRILKSDYPMLQYFYKIHLPYLSLESMVAKKDPKHLGYSKVRLNFLNPNFSELRDTELRIYFKKKPNVIKTAKDIIFINKQRILQKDQNQIKNKNKNFSYVNNLFKKFSKKKMKIFL